MNRRIEVNMMDGLKKLVTLVAFMMVFAAMAAPAMAQGSSSTMGDQSSQGMQTGKQMAPKTAPQTGQAQQGQAATEDLMTIIENNPDLSAYAMALKASGHDQELSGEEPYMVFAPTDQAIKRDLGYTNATTLSSAGKYLLEGTIVQNPQAPSEGSKQAMLTSINGKRIDVMKSDSQVMANGVKIMSATPATNGILVITDGIV
jgi:uncharacterized surface protein with fasciclin (FAS1) repeats